MIYLLVVLYLIVLVFVYDVNRQTEGKELNYSIAYLIMVAVIALRYRVGGDTINYILNFEYFTPRLEDLNLFTVTKRQPIPAFLFSFVKTYLHDFVYIQAIFAIFVNTVIFWFFRTHTKYIFTALLLYAICFYMRLNCEIMRESLAIAFFLLGYDYLVKKRYLKYYIFAFLGFMCHASAVFLFLLPFMYSSVSWLWKFVAGVTVAGIAGLVASTYLGNLLQIYVEAYSSYDSTFFGKLSISLFQICIPTILYLWAKPCTSLGIRKGVLAYAICGVGSLFFYILYRFNNYFMILYIVMVADLINYYYRIYRGSAQSLVKNCVVLTLFLTGFIMPYFSNISTGTDVSAKWYVRWYPYSSIFNPEKNQVREAYISRINNRGQ